MDINLAGSSFVLKHEDTPLVRFRVLRDSAKPAVEIREQFPENRQLVPFGLDISDPADLTRWLCDRAAHAGRSFTDVLLSRQHIDPTHPLHILAFTRALSLNDVYWLEGAVLTSFETVNLYTGSKSLFRQHNAQVSLLGDAPEDPSGGIADVSTGGRLPKAWIFGEDSILLYKSGALMSDFHVRLMQPHSEYFAYMLASAMGLSAVPYALDEFSGVLCSVCPMFTSKDVGFATAASLRLPEDRLSYILAKTNSLQAYEDMRVFDYLTGNPDRHAGNYGFLVDNHANRLMALAPIFDNGEGLYGRWVDGALEKMQVPVLPPTTAVMHALQPRHRPILESLRFFRFEQHPEYPAADIRLQRINESLQQRIENLITLLRGA